MNILSPEVRDASLKPFKMLRKCKSAMTFFVSYHFHSDTHWVGPWLTSTLTELTLPKNPICISQKNQLEFI